MLFKDLIIVFSYFLLLIIWLFLSFILFTHSMNMHCYNLKSSLKAFIKFTVSSFLAFHLIFLTGFTRISLLIRRLLKLPICSYMFCIFSIRAFNILISDFISFVRLFQNGSDSVARTVSWRYVDFSFLLHTCNLYLKIEYFDKDRRYWGD